MMRRLLGPPFHCAARRGDRSGQQPLGSSAAVRPAILRIIYQREAATKHATFEVSPTRRGRLEAVLLVAREPMTLRKLAQLANLTDGTEVRTILANLRKKYDQRGSAFQVEQVAGGYQLLSRSKFAPWLRPLAGREEEIRLSAPALETLAVVAYRQPVLRAEVEAIRGVGCGEILRQLLDRDLLRIVGRSEELGRPLWYATTRRFLQVFGMSQLDELPWAATLRRRSSDGPPKGDTWSTAAEFTAEPPAGDCLTSDNDAA
jgi:segregation and condensation protein B